MVRGFYPVNSAVRENGDRTRSANVDQRANLGCRSFGLGETGSSAQPSSRTIRGSPHHGRRQARGHCSVSAGDRHVGARRRLIGRAVSLPTPPPDLSSTLAWGPALWLPSEVVAFRRAHPSKQHKASPCAFDLECYVGSTSSFGAVGHHAQVSRTILNKPAILLSRSVRKPPIYSGVFLSGAGHLRTRQAGIGSVDALRTTGVRQMLRQTTEAQAFCTAR